MMFPQAIVNLAVASLVGVAPSSGAVPPYELRGGEGHQDHASSSKRDKEMSAFEAFQDSKKGNIERRNLRDRAESDANENSNKINGHSCLRNMEGMTQSMFDLAKRSDLVSIEDIGDSFLKTIDYKPGDDIGLPDDVPLHEGGYDIYAMNITAPDGPYASDEKGKMMIISGVHSREYAPPELNMRFAEALVKGYETDSDITWLLQHTEFHLVLYVNPDGRHIAERRPDLYWRKNLNTRAGGGCSVLDGYNHPGVDINRNYDFAWGDLNGASDDPCASSYHGETPADEPETVAVIEYAKRLFPEDQRKADPMAEVDVPLGENITGLFVDIHSSGGYVYYPWGYNGERSPDDDAQQALGRKVAFYGGYKLWAPGSPDFEYMASGDGTDYMYGVLGVANFGLEIGETFYEDCKHFEKQVIPENLPALRYAAKVVSKPFSLAKGPDILGLQIDVDGPEGDAKVSVFATDYIMLNYHHPGQTTGDQRVEKVLLYLNVHPDNYQEGDTTWEMESEGFYTEPQRFLLDVDISGLSPGKHTLFAQATDTAGYDGPVKSIYFDVVGGEATSLQI